MTSESEKQQSAGLATPEEEKISGFAPLSDLINAFIFLTRLPMPRWRNRTLARSGWAFPLVGLVTGAIGGAVYAGGLWLFGSVWLAALVVLAVMVMITGALHEDGFSDAADGLWGGFSPEKRLAIMRDSNIGGYGAIALFFNLALRTVALAGLAQPELVLFALIAGGCYSRSLITLIMGSLPLAGKTGLAASAGKPKAAEMVVAALLGMGSCSLIGHHLFGPGAAVHLIVWPAMIVLFFMMLVRKKTGGYNGDTLGASQQLAEITVLLTMIALTHSAAQG